jgi:SnoaL-like domain
MTMSSQQLSDLVEIYALKARYFRLLDTMQWDEFRDVFTDDLTFFMENTRTPQSETPSWRGPDALIDNLRKSHPDRISVHQGHMPEIAFLDDNTATGIWAMYDWVDDPARGAAWQGFGHYHERYVRCPDGQWRISSVHLTRLRTDQVPHKAPSAYPLPQPH